MKQNPEDYIGGITANERKAKAREELEKREKIHNKFHEDFKEQLDHGYYFDAIDLYEHNIKKITELHNTLNMPDSFYRLGKPFWHNWFKKK